MAWTIATLYLYLMLVGFGMDILAEANIAPEHNFYIGETIVVCQLPDGTTVEGTCGTSGEQIVLSREEYNSLQVSKSVTDLQDQSGFLDLFGAAIQIALSVLGVIIKPFITISRIAFDSEIPVALRGTTFSIILVYLGIRYIEWTRGYNS